jgi:hypothetical protein
VSIALTLSEQLESSQLIATFRGQPPVPAWPDANSRWQLTLDGSPVKPVPLASLAMGATILAISKEGWQFDQTLAPKADIETVNGRTRCVAVVVYSGARLWRARVTSVAWMFGIPLFGMKTALPVVCEQQACPPNSTTEFDSNWLARQPLGLVFVIGRCSPRLEIRQVNVNQAFSRNDVLDAMAADRCRPSLEKLAEIPNEITVTPLPR